MKKLAILALACIAALGSGASTIYNIRGTEFQTDTLFHAQIGPGTTQTSLLMKSAAGRQMYVRYAIVDLTNPYISISAVMGQDKYAGGETVSGMSKRKSHNGARYFVGTNGDFFRTSGSSSRGESVVGAPIGPCIADGKIYHGCNNIDNWGGAQWTDFTFDENKKPLFGCASFGGTVTCNGKTATMGQVNSEYSCDGVELFTPQWISSTNLGTPCAEVQAMMVEGQEFGIAKPFKLVVTSAVSTAGDMLRPDNGYVIRGMGGSYDFVNGLQVGDTVTFDIRVYMDKKEVMPHTMISSLPKILEKGQILETEWMMSQFSGQQPLTVMGYDSTETKILMVQIDGRSPISSGARTTEGADLLLQLGGWEGLNFDSGGSSTLYTSALGTRNVPSDGTERSDANGFFAVSSAPDDSVIAKIAFVDWVAKVPKYGVYTPKFYGYDQYGMLINTNLEGVTITAPESVGHVQNDTTFYGDGSGCNVLTAHYGDLTCTIPVQILGDGEGIAIVNDSIITDTYKQYAVDVQNTVDGVTRTIDPSALVWRSTDENVVKIGSNTGVLQGVADGEAYVIATIGTREDSMKVIVEKPTAHVMAIDKNLDVSTWKSSQTGGKNAVMTSTGDGFDYTYTGASGRAPKIVLTKTLRLWSLPDTVRLRINPGEAPVKNVLLGIRANGESLTYYTFEIDTLIANKEMTFDLPTNEWIDAADMGNYPLTINSIQLNMNASTTGTEYTIHFNGLETVYNAVKAEPVVKGDVDGNGKVDTSDLSALITIILSNGTATDNPRADVNGDGQVNTSDVSILMAIILGAA